MKDKGIGRRGHIFVPKPGNKEDASVLDEVWTSNFVVQNVDVNFNDDDKEPLSIPGHITKESKSIDFSLLDYQE